MIEKGVTALLLIVLTISCNAEGVVKKELSKSQSLSQLEKDIDACEIGKTYYEKCERDDSYKKNEYSFFGDYSDGYDKDKYYQDKYINEKYFPDFSPGRYDEIWANNPTDSNNRDKCSFGERKVSISNREHNGYIRDEDIQGCMSDKGYIKDSGKWIKSKSGLVYFGHQWIHPKEYIKLHTGIRRDANAKSKTGDFDWNSRIYPRDKCFFKYLSNKTKDYQCYEGGEYYQGKGEYIDEFFYPNVILRDLSKADFYVKDIKDYLKGVTPKVKTLKEAGELTEKNLDKSKVPIKIFVETPKTKDRKSINYIEELRKIKDLLDSGIINQEEFKVMKKKVIDRL
jgi:hypothetical protein